MLGADPAIPKSKLRPGDTPLHWAASSEHASPALVELLLARGANAALQDKQGKTAHDLAANDDIKLALSR